MKKTSRIAVLIILVTVIAMAAPASAYFSSQSLETKAERMVEIADTARDRVLDLVDIVEANTTAMDLIIVAGLDGQFYDNVSLCVEAGTTVGGEVKTENGTGWTYLYAANQSLLAGEYKDAIDNARDALTVFHEVLRSIYVILWEAGVETEQLVAPQVISEAIERSLDRIEELRALLADEELLSKLDDAEVLLNEAKDLLAADEIEDAKDKLKEANDLISEVCQYLKEVAQELNPSRVRGFLDEACCYRERFRERFGHAWDEEFDVDGFLQTWGYQNEEDFMNRFQEMIENAQGEDDIDDLIQELDEIGRLIREMDHDFTQEMDHHHQARYGQEGTTSGSGYGQSSGSGYGGGGSGTSGGQYGGSGFGSMGSGGSP